MIPPSWEELLYLLLELEPGDRRVALEDGAEWALTALASPGLEDPDEWLVCYAWLRGARAMLDVVAPRSCPPGPLELGYGYLFEPTRGEPW